jgi:hypothetical protein
LQEKNALADADKWARLATAKLGSLNSRVRSRWVGGIKEMKLILPLAFARGGPRMLGS